MPYTINKTDGTILTDILDNSVDRTTADLALVGKNTTNYGEYFNENFIKLLENFANPEPPRAPLRGQIWYDTSEDKIKIYNGLVWKDLGRPQISPTEPNLQPGDFWINNNTRQLYFDDGAGTRLAGPIYTAQQGVSGYEVATITDVNGLSKVVVKLKIGNTLVGVFAKETFTPNYELGEGKILQSEGLSGEIARGFTPLNIDFKFNVTAKNAENLVDAFGTPVNVNDFVKTVGDGDIDGRISITGNNKQNPLDTIARPLILGYASNVQFEIAQEDPNDPTIPTVRLRNNLTNQDLTFTVRDSGGYNDAIFVDASASRVGIYNTDPLATLDVNGNVNLRGNLITNNTTVSLVNTTATTVNLAGAATTLTIGATTGDTTVRNNLNVSRDLNIAGGDLTASTLTFNLANTLVRTLNIGGATDNINMGSITGSVNFANDINVAGTLGITGQMLVDNVLIKDNFVAGYGAGNNLELNAFDGGIKLMAETTAEEILNIKRALNFNGLGAITAPVGFANDFLLLNENVNTILMGGDSTRIDIGNTNTVGNVNILNNLRVTRRIYVGDFDNTPSYIDSNGDIINLFNQRAKTVNFAGGADDIFVGNENSVMRIEADTTTFRGDVVIEGGDLRVPAGVTLTTIFNEYASRVTIGSAAGLIELGGSGTTVRVGNALKVGSVVGEIELSSRVSTGTIFVGEMKVSENTAFFEMLPQNVLNFKLAAAAERIEIGKGNVAETDINTPGFNNWQPSTNTGVGATSQLPITIIRNNLLVRDKLLIPNLDTAVGSGGAGLLYKNIYQELEASVGVRLVGNTLAITGDCVVTGNFVGSDQLGIAKIPRARMGIVEITDSISTDLATIDLFTSNATDINIGGELNGNVTLGSSTTVVKIPGFLRETWRTVSTLRTAVAGDKLLINTSANNVQITLPATPSVGDTVQFLDAYGISPARQLFIYRNGSKINAVDADINIQTAGVAFTLVYTGVTRGWCYDHV